MNLIDYLQNRMQTEALNTTVSRSLGIFKAYSNEMQSTVAEYIDSIKDLPDDKQNLVHKKIVTFLPTFRKLLDSMQEEVAEYIDNMDNVESNAEVFKQYKDKFIKIGGAKGFADKYEDRAYKFFGNAADMLKFAQDVKGLQVVNDKVTYTITKFEKEEGGILFTLKSEKGKTLEVDVEDIFLYSLK